uniref:DUF1907 domain-containing protein n=1 Tax=Angiostrongylus cantonensis TaxID=6313 RepID=A0A0K0D1Z3_ANGCA
MNHSLYPYNENYNHSQNGATESIYSTLTASQLQLHASTSVQDAAVAVTMMRNSPLVERPMSIDEHLQSMPCMPMTITGWSEQFRLQDEKFCNVSFKGHTGNIVETVPKVDRLMGGPHILFGAFDHEMSPIVPCMEGLLHFKKEPEFLFVKLCVALRLCHATACDL